MKHKIKTALLCLLGAVTLACASGCGTDPTPYETNNAENYTVSVKYDANGGMFTTNTSVIVDSYNLNDIDKNAQGLAEIALLPPDSEWRGNDAFTAINNGYFLAGWYEGRTETTDELGNKSYTYSNRWDFENGLLKVDPSKTYSSETPVITLYAAWVPLFEVEFYSLDNGQLLDKYTFDPTQSQALTVPAWNESTGLMEMYSFPERAGYTFKKAYYDQQATQAVETDVLQHTGVINLENGTAVNPVMKVYVDWLDGEWYHIYNAQQLIDNANVNGNYEIFADLDFEGEIWPTAFMYGNFGGVINGNGHTLKNISFAQTNNSKVNAGLFGYITDTARISDITLDNVTFTVQKGTRVVGTSYGLFAGTVSNEAQISNVKILASTLQIDTACYFGVDDYSIGLVCGMGNHSVIPDAEINCTVVGDAPESLSVTVDGNTVTIQYTE